MNPATEMQIDPSNRRCNFDKKPILSVCPMKAGAGYKLCQTSFGTTNTLNPVHGSF
jgi:hypothetical protein